MASQDSTTITRKKFIAYRAVQFSGGVNMFDVRGVVRLADEIAGVKLSRADFLEIMENFSVYVARFETKSDDAVRTYPKEDAN